ncbi:hypothetical protein S40285_09891 [Stachybotrys chlorohalonatus IBT 40285]|uniref:Uncharacterized protein n=1 Tax=Stachybotrys chlorohalonatus (strain IBT 40285) TaxID=1283841 RepID=A0A084QY29_STAC4|nr:hypothetical protein S40285_09891 [Stachybotrys chlorohalonata IBT 40285]
MDKERFTMVTLDSLSALFPLGPWPNPQSRLVAQCLLTHVLGESLFDARQVVRASNFTRSVFHIASSAEPPADVTPPPGAANIHRSFVHEASSRAVTLVVAAQDLSLRLSDTLLCKCATSPCDCSLPPHRPRAPTTPPFAHDCPIYATSRG